MDKHRFDEIFANHYIVQYPQDIYRVVEAADKIKPKVIIEIGVEKGGTLAFWHEMVGSGGTVIAIDINDVLINNVVKPEYINTDREMHFIIGDSTKQETIDKVHSALNGRKPDYVFIDGCHDDDVVLQDISNYGNLVRSGGLIGFDDMTEVIFNTLPNPKERIGQRNALCWK